MALDDIITVRIVKQFLAGDCDALDWIISQYEAEVYKVALHLTNDESVAAEVVEETFVRLYKELPEIYTDSLESAVHQLAYEIALGRLLGRIDNHLQEVGEFFDNAILPDRPTGPTKETRVVFAESHECPVTKAGSTMDKAAQMINESCEQLGSRRLLC